MPNPTTLYSSPNPRACRPNPWSTTLLNRGSRRCCNLAIFYKKIWPPVENGGDMHTLHHKGPWTQPGRQGVCSSMSVAKPNNPPAAFLFSLADTISAHGDCQWYHEKFNHHDAEIYYTCTSYSRGAVSKGPEHMVHCEAARAYKDKWPRPPKPKPRSDGI